MIFGLNAYLAIGGSLTTNILKYDVKINDKNRWGKIPLEKSMIKKNDSHSKT